LVLIERGNKTSSVQRAGAKRLKPRQTDSL
jgi:hypothetical protein